MTRAASEGSTSSDKRSGNGESGAARHANGDVGSLAEAHAVGDAAERVGQVDDVGDADDLEQPVVHRRAPRRALHVLQPRRERSGAELVPEVGAAAVGRRVEHHEAIDAVRDDDGLAVAGEGAPA